MAGQAGLAGQAGQAGLAGQAGQASLAGHAGLAGLASLAGLSGQAGLAGQAGQTGQTGQTGQAGLAGLPRKFTLLGHRKTLCSDILFTAPCNLVFVTVNLAMQRSLTYCLVSVNLDRLAARNAANARGFKHPRH